MPAWRVVGSGSTTQTGSRYLAEPAARRLATLRRRSITLGYLVLRDVVHAPARRIAAGHHPHVERRIVRTALVPHDLNPLHRG